MTGFLYDVLIWEGLIATTHFFKINFSNSFGENNDIFIFFVRKVCAILPICSQKSAGNRGHLEVIFQFVLNYFMCFKNKKPCLYAWIYFIETQIASQKWEPKMTVASETFSGCQLHQRSLLFSTDRVGVNNLVISLSQYILFICFHIET